MDAPESIPLTTPRNRKEADKLFAKINEIDDYIEPLAAIRDAVKTTASELSKKADATYKEATKPYEESKEVMIQLLGEYGLLHWPYLYSHFKQKPPLNNGTMKLITVGESLITDDVDEEALMDFLETVPGGEQFIRTERSLKRDEMKTSSPAWQQVFAEFGAEVSRQLHITVLSRAMEKAKRKAFTVYRLLIPSGTIRTDAD